MQVINILDLPYTEIQFQEYVKKNFSCIRKVDGQIYDDVQNFLYSNAYKYGKNGKSITYLIIDNSPENILGYFSISSNKITVSCDINKNTAYNLFALDISDDKRQAFAFSSYLIGQIARNDKCPKEKLSGEEIMHQALSVIYRVFELIGGRIITLDCVDKLVGYYEKYGFVKVSKNEKTKLNQMYLLTKKVFDFTN